MRKYIDATNGKQYTYTKGVDTTDRQLLCITDSETALSDIKWGSLNNPLVLNSADNQDVTTVCNTVSSSSTILSVNLVIQGEYKQIFNSITQHFKYVHCSQ